MLLPIALVVVLVVAPLAFALAGRSRAAGTHARPESRPAGRWRATVASLLSYTLAFNLIFLVQELALVLPKAFTPGLSPTLFHNNHTWTGHHPLAALFQGTGALATLLLGLAAVVWLRRARSKPRWVRLLLFWGAFAGVFMALPQVVLGALLPNGDVGMAMDYFSLTPGTKTAIALIALFAMPCFARCLLPPLLELAERPFDIADGAARTRFVFRIATLPGLLAIATIVLFRVPREWIEVALVPTVVTLVGLIWLQAAAWSVRAAHADATPARWPLWTLGWAAIALLVLFQGVLRRGIAF